LNVHAMPNSSNSSPWRASAGSRGFVRNTGQTWRPFTKYFTCVRPGANSAGDDYLEPAGSPGDD
jgi:hypothetical protein